MQAWEYKVIHRQRQVRAGAVDSWDTNVISQLPRLGAEGWELITILPRSSEGGAPSAGVTSDELWVFKRPKSIVSAEAMVIVAEAVETPEPLSEMADAVAQNPN